MNITQDDIEVLQQQTLATLANWHYQLNSWGWPPDIQNPEPRIKDLRGRRGEIMDWIESRIGHKQCLREHWRINEIERPDYLFDDWYKENAP